MESKRIYINKRINELEYIFNNNMGSLDVLNNLSMELTHRTTKTSRTLAEKVQKQISKLISSRKGGKKKPCRPGTSQPCRHIKSQFNVYVIELGKDIATVPKFLRENPQYVGTMPCVYVGLTGRSPEERFQNHKNGYKACKFVTRYGLRLLPHLYVHLNPMAYDDAKKTEPDLASQLREKGYGVWQK